jgi:hypothetical protein
MATGASVMPYGSVSGADRPTFSLTPLDDGEFARKLFTPLSLEGAVYLARTTWPIQTVFRLYLENLNWVPNGELASGPPIQRKGWSRSIWKHARCCRRCSSFLTASRSRPSMADRGWHA